jgi:hypothetical protein
MTSQPSNRIFEESIEDYHKKDDIDAALQNPYSPGSIESLLYAKNWIDTVQWHLEDMIRAPGIDPVHALEIKRRIDRSNQQRTDMVEQIDNWFLTRYKDMKPQAGASINTESPAWALDRLSILAIKIYHMRLEAQRTTASELHRQACEDKLGVLLQQQGDLSRAIDELLDDIANGRKYMKVYLQMKMYNDQSLNPVLYQQKK